eukprot:13679715-Alexandrium_andersonii.AAC.1
MHWASSCGASWCVSMRLPSSRSSSANPKSAGRTPSAARMPRSSGPDFQSGGSGGVSWRS